MILVDKEIAPLWIENLDEEKYHGDKTAVNSNSLKKILKSPASFRAAFYGEKEPTPSMKLGTLLHKAVLEGSDFLSRYVVMPEFWGYTQKGEKTNSANCKEVKEQKAAWMSEQVENNRIIVTQEEQKMIVGICESISNHKYAFDLLRNIKTEISGYYSDPVTGIRSRIRMDGLSNDGTYFLDVKSTQDCQERAFSRSIHNYRYDFQTGMYMEGAKVINEKPLDFAVLIAVEKEEPYEIAVYTADDTILETGATDYRRAMDRLALCLKEDKWDFYQQTIQNIGLPYYALQE